MDLEYRHGDGALNGRRDISRGKRHLVWLLAAVGALGAFFLVEMAWRSVTRVASEAENERITVSAFSSAQRELSAVSDALLRLHHEGTVDDVFLHRDLLLQQLRAIAAGTPARTEASSGDGTPHDREDVEQIAEDVRSLDWDILKAAVGSDSVSAIQDAVRPIDSELEEIDSRFRRIHNDAEARFYAVTDEVLRVKARSERMLFGLAAVTAVVAGFVVAVVRRRSRRKVVWAESALKVSEERFRSLVQKSSDMTLLLDEGGQVTFASPAVEVGLGCRVEDLIGQRFVERVHPDDQAAFEVELGSKEPKTGFMPFPGRVRRDDGRWLYAEIAVSNLLGDPSIGGIVLNVRDVSDRHRLERELRQAQKLESVGQLAAGVAHEINTPIQFVGDNVRFLSGVFRDLTQLTAAYERAARASGNTAELSAAEGLAAQVDAAFLIEEAPLAIEQTLEGVARVSTIVGAMRAFAHPSNAKAPADINEAIRNTLLVAASEIKYVADVVTDLGDLPMVMCHVGDIDQVLLNLLVNAAHAIRERAGASDERGCITVRTRHEVGDVVITIADTGDGIPDEIATRVFEPFFTTKDVGKGTGQGLSICYALITERHGGHIEFESQAGIGTTFTVRLPVNPRDHEVVETTLEVSQ